MAESSVGASRWGRLFLAGCTLVATSCSKPAAPGDDGALRVAGQSMGTTWSLVAVPGLSAPSAAQLQAIVQAELDDVDGAMSSWIADSELSRFNRLGADESLEIGAEMTAVMQLAVEVWTRTGGAFDPTVGPLVDAWGFGGGATDNPSATPPESAELEALLEAVGFDQVAVHGQAGQPGRVTKLNAQVEVDLSAIAKGYGVDEAATALDAMGLAGYFMELGGEVRIAGLSPRGDRWRIGVDRPLRPGAGQSGTRQAALVLSPASGAVATSGDYRNWREVDGQLISHTIDPRTGRPLVDGPASVTVVGPSCAAADAYATALMVMGAEQGLALLEDLAGYEGLFLEYGDQLEDGNWALIERETGGFAVLRVTQQP